MVILISFYKEQVANSANPLEIVLFALSYAGWPSSFGVRLVLVLLPLTKKMTNFNNHLLITI
jgi:hypothetical protein